MTPYQYCLIVFTPNRTVGNALAVALGGIGDAAMFDDENCAHFVDGITPVYGVEVLVREDDYNVACDFRDGGYPAVLGLDTEQIDAARAVVVVIAGPRATYENGLAREAALLGYAA